MYVAVVLCSMCTTVRAIDISPLLIWDGEESKGLKNKWQLHKENQHKIKVQVEKNLPKAITENNAKGTLFKVITSSFIENIIFKMKLPGLFGATQVLSIKNE